MWPNLRVETSIRKWVFPLIFGLTSKDYWLQVIKIFCWCTVYISGVHYLQIPYTDKSIASQVIQNWWLLGLFDTFFTGFGLSNASIFSLGSLSSFVIAYKISLKGNSSRIRKFTKIELIYLIAISLLLTAWYVRNGVVLGGTKGVLYTFFILLIGGFISRFITMKLIDLEFGLGTFFGLLVLYRVISVNHVIAVNYKSVILLGTLFFLNIIHLFIINKKYQSHVWNISGKDFEISAFPFPFIGEKIFINLIYSTVAYSILIYSIMSFFPVKTQLLSVNTVFVTCITFLVISILFVLYRSPELSSIISKFDPVSIAKAFKREYWIFEEIKPGEETIQYLSEKYREITTRSFFYSLFVLVVIVGQWILFQHLRKGDYLFDYGIFGLIFLLMATYQIPNLIFKFYDYGRIAYSKIKWKYDLSSDMELTIVNPSTDYSSFNIDEIIINLVDSRYKEDVIRILNSCKTRKDYLKAIVILTKYITKERELSLMQIILSMIQIFGGVFILSVFIFGATSVLIKLFNLNIALSNKDYFFVLLTFVSFWIAVSVSIFSWCHPDLLKQLKRKIKRH